MMTMNRKAGLILAVVLFLTASFAVSLPLAFAGGTKLEIKADTTMHDVLAGLTGKRAALRLRSGEDMEGTIVLVGDSLVHLTKLSGREFYDAVISIDQVSAVIIRVRNR